MTPSGFVPSAFRSVSTVLELLLFAGAFSAGVAIAGAPGATRDCVPDPRGLPHCYPYKIRAVVPYVVPPPGVLANDGDPDGDPITAILVSPTVYGTIDLRPDGGYTYTPSAGYVGTDYFTYKANDGMLDSNTVVVGFHVNGIPNARSDVYRIDEGTQLDVASPGVIGNDDDGGGSMPPFWMDILTAGVQTPPASGTLSFHESGAFTYLPNPGFSGTDSFTYELFDRWDYSAPATVRIVVDSLNQPPVSVDDAATTAAGQSITINVLANDSDPEGGTLTVSLESYATHGVATCSLVDCRYEPGTGFVGTDSFTYSVRDQLGASATATVTVNVINCPSVPASVAPVDGAYGVATDGTLQWSDAGADEYAVYFGPAGEGCATLFATTVATSAPYSSLSQPGAYEWRVEARRVGCAPVSSSCSRFQTGCPVPSLAAPGEVTSGVSYLVTWGGTASETVDLEESRSETFAEVVRASSTTGSLAFTHAVEEPTAFYYRAATRCGNASSAYSAVVRTVVTPAAGDPTAILLTAPAGTASPLIASLHLPTGADFAPGTPFTASTDRAWLTTDPLAGVVAPDGVDFTVTVTAVQLAAGTHFGTLVVESGAGKRSIPVSLVLTTPVHAGGRTLTDAHSMIIPAAAHLTGANSYWRSDIRLMNAALRPLDYELTFTPSGENALRRGKQTRFDLAAGETIALDDIVRRWFGIGGLAEGTNGSLHLVGHAADGSVAAAEETRVTSRTYTIEAGSTFGQFVPAVPYEEFIGRQEKLILPHVAENDRYRTNVGLVEGSGADALVRISPFAANGTALGVFDVPLGAGEQRQLNGLLREHSITVDDAWLELEVISATGRVTAYASVIDRITNDPFLVPPLRASAVGGTALVLPGIADFRGGSAQWRSDVRIVNAGNSSASVTLTFYPDSHPESPLVASLEIQPRTMAVLDGILANTFGATNVGGALRVSTAESRALLVTARTYDQRSDGGTFGQFIPGVKAEQGADLDSRSIELLQIEHSSRFRTNLGIAEVSGAGATVEISAAAAETASIPPLIVDLRPNEFRQIVGVFPQMGLAAAYNGRISVRVVSGTGRVVAYASVVDNSTQDPTYVPGQ